MPLFLPLQQGKQKRPQNSKRWWKSQCVASNKVGVKPLIIFGHDECIYKQQSMTKKCWIRPKGKINILPKGDRLGIMISMFVSRETCCRLEVSSEQPEKSMRQGMATSIK